MAAYLLKVLGVAALFAGAHGQVYGTAGAVGAGPEGIGPTVIDWEGPLVPQDYPKPLFNDYGFVVRGNLTNGEEFTLWLFMYRQIGEVEFITDEDLFQLTFIHGNFTEVQKESMNDTPFVNIGQDIEDYAPIGTVTTFQNSSYVEYTFENFTFGAQDTASQEKIWFAKGSRGGVTVDILMPQHGDEIYHAGAFSDLENCSPNTTSTNYNCTGDFGGIVHASGVTGTLSYNDTSVTIETAYAVHERIIQAGAVPSRVLSCAGNGATWIHSWGNRLDTWTFTTDYGPLSQAFVNIDGETLGTTSIANTSIVETSHWIDPKSNQLIPSAWHMYANFPNGRMDSYVTGFGRLYYYWMRKGGLITIYQYLATAETIFTYPNGTSVSETQVAFIEYFRTIYISTPNPNTPSNFTT